MASTRHGIQLMVASQAQKEVTFNEAIILLAVLTQTIVKEVGRDTPPASPADWDMYVVGAAPTGAWTGHTNDLALYDGTGWVFYTPAEGSRVWDLATASHWTCAGAFTHRLQGRQSMTPEDHTTAIHVLQNAISEIKAILNCPEGTPQASTAFARWSTIRRPSSPRSRTTSRASTMR